MKSSNAKNTREIAVSNLKQSFTMQRNSGQDDLAFMEKELEKNLKTFNDKFMETLTTSLTQQLGFDLTQAVEDKRKMTVGSSFIEKSSSGGLDLNFGQSQSKDTKSPIKNPNLFGPQTSLGHKPMSMSASVLVPGIGGHRMPNKSQIPDHAQNMKIANQEGDLGKKLSIIRDTETINEQDTINETDTVQDENLRGSDEEDNQNKKRPLDDPNKLKQSHLSNDQQSLLEEMLSKRASLLASQHDKNSMMVQEDAEMKDEQPVVVEEDDDFEEVAIQDCSEEEEEQQDDEDDENDPLEQRDVPDEELFNKIERKEQE